MRRLHYSQAEIAKTLSRSPSTISRELRRNVTHHDGWYRAQKAHSYATARRSSRRRGSWFSANQWHHVEILLKRKWSPEQVSFTLNEQGICIISQETIYRYILKDKKAGGNLYRFMRIMPKKRRRRYNSKDSRGVLRGKRHISERPAEVELRQEPGHWEGDTVMGVDKRFSILTLVERRSGFAIIKKLKARTTLEVNAAAINAIAEHRRMFNTITFDNGTEFHDYKQLESRFSVNCYFATPYHSWEQGSNESLNGLIRQYVPKGACMKLLTQERCDEIAEDLNTRPRKRHGFKTPSELYYVS
ncbi:IS30 family transposase [Synechococcus sp. CS-1324]|nr:IS30 family transposase [Synechococcus sp. CS-1324]